MGRRLVDEEWAVEFLKRLHEAIESAGMTQVELAYAIGASPQTVNSWMMGKTLPPPDLLTYLCDEMKVSADWLLGRSDEGGPMPPATAEEPVPGWTKLEAMEREQERTGMTYGQIQAQKYIEIQRREMREGRKRGS